jgi:septin 7
MATSLTNGSSTGVLLVDDQAASRSVSLGPSNSPSEMARKLGQFIRHSEEADQLIAAVANGVPAPTRASPTPNMPNGKAPSPYVERSNPMGQGATQTVSSKDPKAVAMAASDMRNVVRRKLTGYVGFANLPNQWHRKSVRKGFNFNVMVVG